MSPRVKIVPVESGIGSAPRLLIETAELPSLNNIANCSNWKSHIPFIIQGGFNSDFHPIAIEKATANAKGAYRSTGYFPDPGSTEIWKLGEEMIPLIKKELEKLKESFPAPEALE